jgi:hypothetical protein
MNMVINIENMFTILCLTYVVSLVIKNKKQ